MQLFQCTCVGEKNDNHFWNCFSCRNISSLVMKMFDELLLAHQDIAKWSCENENSKQTIHLMKAEMESINKKRSCLQTDVSAAERRGTPVLLSSSVSNNSDNSPQMAVPRRSREIRDVIEGTEEGRKNHGRGVWGPPRPPAGCRGSAPVGGSGGRSPPPQKIFGM